MQCEGHNATRRPGGRAAAALAGAAALAAAAFAAVPAGATTPGRPGSIAYTVLTYQPKGKAYGYIGPGNIHSVGEDGRDRVLTSGPDDDYEPAFSPTGGRIAFTSNRAAPRRHKDRYSLFVMGADGSRITRLTTTLRKVDAAAWAPDGRTIAFDGDKGIYVVGADGKGLRLLVRSPEGRVVFVPAWFPDGSALVFTRARVSSKGNTISEAIWTVRADGTQAKPLVGGQGLLRYSQQPDVSPDGTQVTFLASNAVYVAGIDGRGARQVAAPPERGFLNGPSWSPDGTRIVYSRANGRTARTGAALETVAVATGVKTVIRAIARGGIFAPNWQPRQ